MNTGLLFFAVSGGLSAWLPIILVIAAVLLFAIAAFWNPPSPPPWNRLVSAGLFCWALAQLIVMVGGL